MTTPLRVLVVSNHWKKKENKTFGGVWVDRQVTALKNLGVEVHTHDIGTSHAPRHLWEQWRLLRSEVRRLQPHVVHARYGTITASLCVFSGAPSVITYAGSDLLPGAGISFLRTWFGITLSNLASLKANGLICVSEQLRRALWFRSRAAIVIPDGVNLEAFFPRPQLEARQHLGWDPATKVVVIDGARDPINKGLEIAKEAVRMLEPRFPGITLKVLSGIQPSDMPYHYCAADVLLCASRQEGSPNVVKEAMACNCPVVATDVGDVRERLQGVEPSCIVERNPSAMAQGLERVLSQNRRSNGREHVVDLSIEKIAERVCQVYSRIRNLSSV